jgi:hypothetical protein
MLNIKLRVKNLVTKYRTGDPFQLAGDLGIKIVRLPLPDDMRGFLVNVLRRKYIVLNDELCYAAEKVTVCHELGHARLHAGYGYHLHPDRTVYVSSRLEREANEYAAHLLAYSTDIDSDEVTRIINQRRPDPREVHLLLGRFIDTQVW